MLDRAAHCDAGMASGRVVPALYPFEYRVGDLCPGARWRSSAGCGAGIDDILPGCRRPPHSRCPRHGVKLNAASANGEDASDWQNAEGGGTRLGGGEGSRAGSGHPMSGPRRRFRDWADDRVCVGPCSKLPVPVLGGREAFRGLRRRSTGGPRRCQSRGRVQGDAVTPPSFAGGARLARPPPSRHCRTVVFSVRRCSACGRSVRLQLGSS